MLLDGTTFLRVITVPMSARIAHPNLEIFGLILMSLCVCIVMQHVRGVQDF